MFLSSTTDCLQKKVFSKDTFSESDDAITLPSMSVGMVVTLFFCKRDFVSLNQFFELRVLSLIFSIILFLKSVLAFLIALVTSFFFVLNCAHKCSVFKDFALLSVGVFFDVLKF